ncbi:succinyl-CoA synthetase-like protein [Bombardia bombarda]|uniref:Succinyl-CoA synthetase-like protein n=1 Tax=Bombardia bombarda TaxID=252184 RepID=A0AA39WNP4_9PEZI|nr:succinyl-CoA synthetase-like protein [Bombardia bombarda]
MPSSVHLETTRPLRTWLRALSTTSSVRSYSYADTLPNLRIGSHTRVIFQGFTGKQATANARDSMAWGTKIVGGVTPGRTGEHLGLPILPTVRRAMELLKPDATGIYVAAHQAVAAIEEAIEAEVPLIVAVAEHIPLHDMLRIMSILKTQSTSRLVGANSPGIISAVGRCRIGFQPLPCFSPGSIGIIAKSGTLSYETVASTTRAGLGQSLCIGVGGDIVPGTDLREALSVLESDPDTAAIALIGEIGGSGEMDAASWINEYHSRTSLPKPIVGLVAGADEARGHIMGHAGAFTAVGEPDANAKIAALKNAGVTMINHPAKFGAALRARLVAAGETTLVSQTVKSNNNNNNNNNNNRSSFGVRSTTTTTTQRRPFHMAPRGGRRPQRTGTPSLGAAAALAAATPSASASASASAGVGHQQRRQIYLSEDKCMDMLRAAGQINCGAYSGHGERRLLAISIDRSARSPCIIAAPVAAPAIEQSSTTQDAKKFPFDFRRGGPDELAVERIASHLRLSNKGSAVDSLRRVIRGLVDIFYRNEAFLLATHVVERLGEIKVVGARFGFDDAAFSSGGRQGHLQELRDASAQDDPELAVAKKSGIVYIKLAGDGTIGTLVNGAGLAMNTVDALEQAGGKAANFLDTGGKATSETVKESFGLILRDSRVRVIFVNIFGGLTLGDMIARGVILAFKELSPRVPIVVRIRGTNEEEGQRLIAESGLPLHAFDDFEEAAAKAIELSRVDQTRL